MKITFSYGAFLASHGAMPRGRGSWAFVFGKADYEDVSEVTWCREKDADGQQLTFAKARAWAAREARRRGVDLVGVCP